MIDVQSSAGLAGVVAGRTALSTVGQEGCGLTYRGYAIEDLAEYATFEEVAWLLLRGRLPGENQLHQYRQWLGRLRHLPPPLANVLEQLPAAAHPMDVLRTGCSALGCLEPESDTHTAMAIADRLLATFPAFVLMVRNHDALTLVLGVGLLSALSSTSVGVAIVSLTESLSKGVRSAGLAVVYAVGVSVFGGVAQPYVTWLIKATGSPMAPAWYLMAAAGIGIVAMSFMRESRPASVALAPSQ